jgi:hypothetical protein
LTETALIPSVQRSLWYGKSKIPTLLALVALADFLIFGQEAGINLFLFAPAVSIGVLLPALSRVSPLSTTLLFGLSVLASLPLAVAPSVAGILISILFVIFSALASSRLMPAVLSRLPLTILRFVLVAPLRLVEDWLKHFALRATRPTANRLSRGLALWAMPLILASMFLILFAIANPLIEEMLRKIDLSVLLQFLDIWRIAFWLFIAATVWPMLRPRLKRRGGRPKVAEPVAELQEDRLFGYASVLRSLIVFNGLFAVQTSLDLIYLWGGADLPDGMSHAEYAHRGAYPLIATAFLAAAFVLIAMRRNGPGDRSKLIRGLVHFWIAQNILLCISSILRLDLYVEVYSLTELRIAAGVWMSLVAAGLLLILLRILFVKSNEWLIAANLLVLIVVLYISALIDFQAFIARFNVEHSFEMTNQGMPLDTQYLLSLGPSALPALDHYIAALPVGETAKMRKARIIRGMLASAVELCSRDWRSWTFRTAATRRYLSENPMVARWGENDDK